MPDPPPYYDVRFSGTVLIGTQSLIATVFLRGGQLSVVALEQIPTIQVSTLFDQFCGSVAGLSLIWPSEIFDLTLSKSWIFYICNDLTIFPQNALPRTITDDQKTAITGDQRARTKGLFIATTISLDLAGYKCQDVDSRIYLENGKGFRIDAKLTKFISLPSSSVEILRLTGPESPNFSGGPHLSLQSFDEDGPNGAKRTFRLRCAFSLFKTSYVVADLKISSDNPPKLAATLIYRVTLGPFINPELSFTWSKDQGFHLQNFPSITIPDVALDFIDLLKKVSNSPKYGCGDLAGLVLKDGVKIDQKFFVEPSLSTNPSGSTAVSDPHLYVLINGYYKVSAAGQLVVTVNLPQLVLTLSAPSEFTFGGIVDKIKNTIIDNAESVVEQLWKDKVKLGKFVAVFVAAGVLKTVASQGLAKTCDFLRAVGEQFAEELAKGALDTVGNAMGTVGGVIGGPMAGACAGGGGDDNGGGGGTSSTALTAPIITRRAVSAGAVAVEWSVVPLAAGYEVQLVDSTVLRRLVGSVLRLPASATTKTIQVDPPAVAAGTYIILLKALADANSPATDSDYATASIIKLTAPAIVTMSYDPVADVLTAQWSVVTYATAYLAQVRNMTTDTVAKTAITAPSTTGAGTITQSFPAAQFGTRAAGNYTVSVQAQAGETYITGNATAATPALPMLLAPASVQQQRLDDRLRVMWAPTSGTSGYRLIVTNLNTAEEAVRLTVMQPEAGTGGLLQYDVNFTDFTKKTAGLHKAAIAAIGDAAHIGSGTTASPTEEVLFSGIGFSQIGVNFTIS